MIRKFANKSPQLGEAVYVDETAVVIGDVNVGTDSSIWPMAVLRGDINQIIIGERSNIQDGSVIHVTHAGQFNSQGYATIIGDEVIVGHKAVLHGCTIHNHVLIGIGVIVMDGATIESHVIIGAGSLIPPHKKICSGLWIGSPAKKIRDLTDQELAFLSYSTNYYVELKNRYLSPLPQEEGQGEGCPKN